MTTRDDGYLLDNRQVEAGTRFAALAELFDPVDVPAHGRFGVAPGGRCWEVGAGGRRCRPGWPNGPGRTGGYSPPTSTCRGWATAIVCRPAGRPPPRSRYAATDVGRDDPPEGLFDLVHARLVLVHVPDRERALRSMAGVLRPGGWLFVEDADPALQPLICPDEYGPEQELANRLRRGFRTLLAERGADLGVRADAAPAAARRGAGRRGRRRVLPDQRTGLRRAGGRDGRAGPRPARRRGAGHRRGDRPASGGGPGGPAGPRPRRR